MSEKRKTTCDETNENSTKKVKHQFEHSTCFTDLPNEIILLICHYLTPAHVLESFLGLCNKRLYSCISDYHQKIDFTKYSYQDFNYYMMLFESNRIHPSTLILSNTQLIRQIQIFFERILPLITYDLNHVRHLSLIKCPLEELSSFNSNLSKFKSLETLRIVQLIPNNDNLSTSYLVIENIIYFIFYTSNIISEFYLIINDGLILSKHIPPNRNLKYLTVSLQHVNDLYVLLDGLVPNLIILHVTLSKSDIHQRFLLPNSWPHQSMSHLKEFKLTTNPSVEFSFHELCNIVIPFIKLNVLSLYINQWVSDEEQFVQGNQLQTLFEQFMPELEKFYCYIKTDNVIDMQSFSKFNERWPMKCCSESISSYKYLYTIPWSFKQLNMSMLANDDTNTVCPNVQFLTLDISSTSAYISRRFPNIHTLTILPGCRLFHDDCLGFRQLRHLIMENISIVPTSIIQRIHTMTLSDTDGLSTHSMIYPNIKCFYLRYDRYSSFTTVKTVIQYFPNLHSLEIPLRFAQKAEYYDSLNILLDGNHLPNLLLLKTNCISGITYYSRVSMWILAKTSMRWRSTVFCAYRDGDDLTICL